jgi:hypothetical protein
VAVSVGPPLLSLANSFAPALGFGAVAVSALQNSTEWWRGLVFTLLFFALAWLSRASPYATVAFCAGRGSTRGWTKPAPNRAGNVSMLPRGRTKMLSDCALIMRVPRADTSSG